MRRIMFVCAGNTCRSPMAAALARNYLLQRGIVNVEVESAGEAAFGGAPATPEAQKVMEEHGLVLTDHRARALDEEMLARTDLVLTMTLGQRDLLRRRWPERAASIFCLKEYAAGADADAERARALELAVAIAAEERLQTAGETRPDPAAGGDERAGEVAELVLRLQSYDVADPWGRGREEYRRCAAELEDAVTSALDRFLLEEGEGRD